MTEPLRDEGLSLEDRVAAIKADLKALETGEIDRGTAETRCRGHAGVVIPWAKVGPLIDAAELERSMMGVPVKGEVEEPPGEVVEAPTVEARPPAPRPPDIVRRPLSGPGAGPKSVQAPTEAPVVGFVVKPGSALARMLAAAEDEDGEPKRKPADDPPDEPQHGEPEGEPEEPDEEEIREAATVPAEAKSESVGAPGVRSVPLPDGLVGEIAEFTLANVMYPVPEFAIMLGLGVVGTLIGRRVAGPTDAGTHLLQGGVAETTAGKQDYRRVGKALMISVGAGNLIGPGRFKSGAGIIKHLIKKPASLCFPDELGAYFAALGDKKSAALYRDQNEIIRELYGTNFDRFDSPEGAVDDSRAIYCPALSMFGTSTPKELWAACKGQDAFNGFLNRWCFREVIGLPKYQKRPEKLEIPPQLVLALRRLFQPEYNPGEACQPGLRLEWGPRAEAVFDDFREGVRQDKDELRRWICGRSPERSVRLGTIIGAGAFAKSVTRGWMDWALAWVRDCDRVLLKGFEEWGEEEKIQSLNQGVREIIRAIRTQGTDGKIPKWLLGKIMGKKVQREWDYKSAKDHMIATRQLFSYTEKTEGRTGTWYSLEPVINAPPDDE